MGLGRAWLKSTDPVGNNDTELRRWTPRLGLIYTPAPETHVRFSLGQNLGLREVGSASLAPVETAGIVNIRPGDLDKVVKSAGLGFDHRLGMDWLVNGEVQFRRTLLPLIDFFTGEQYLTEFSHREGELKLNWVPAGGRIAAGISAGYEKRTNEDDFFALDSIKQQRLRDLTLSANWFVDSKLTLKAEVGRNWVDGDYLYVGPFDDASTQVNASLQWKLPQGRVELGVRNLLDDDFEYTESDPLAPRFSEGRLIYGSARINW
jgi:outer membrane receptor protein involved in Fe transport